MIKKIKIASIFVNEEKEITSKKDGKKYNVCNVNVKVADDCQDFAGKYIQLGIFGYKDEKDPSKNKSATDKANYFKEQSDGKEIILEVNEEKYTDKDGFEATALRGKVLSKAAREAAEKILG